MTVGMAAPPSATESPSMPEPPAPLSAGSTDPRLRSVELFGRAFLARDVAAVPALCQAGCQPALWLDVVRRDGAEAEVLARTFLSHALVTAWLAPVVTGDVHALRAALTASAAAPECLDYPMVVAAGDGQIDVIRVLQEFGADPHGMACAPLMLAAANDRVETVRYLHSQLGDGFATVSHRAMAAAAEQGAFTTVQYLHQAGADLAACAPFVPDLVGRQAHIPLLEYLARHGIEPHGPLYARLLHVVAAGHVSGMRQVLTQIPVLPQFQPIVMRYAGKSGRVKVVRTLCEAGFDLSAHGDQIVLTAAAAGHARLVIYCLEKGADISRHGAAVMRAAFDSGNVELLTRLHQMGQPIEAIDADALTAAKFDARLEVLDYATANGADAIANDRQGIMKLVAAINEAPEAFRPSRAWQFFKDVHLELLRRDGLHGFKQSLTQSYFTSIPTSWADPQLSPLIKAWREAPSLFPLSIRWAREGPVQHGLDSGFARLRYRTLLGLLWYQVLRTDRLGLADRVAESRIGSPLPARLGHRQVSQDLAHSVLECNSIFEGRAETLRSERLTIAEVGAGYGRLGPLMVGELNCRYVAFDIAPALYINQWYQSAVLTGKKVFGYRRFERYEDIAQELNDSDVAFFSVDQMALFPDACFDISVNISSLHEMHHAQIATVLGEMYRVTRESVYLKQYHAYKNPWDDIHVNASDYFVPDGWRIRFDRQVAVDERFFERSIERVSPPPRMLTPPTPHRATVSIVLANFNHAKYLETSLWGLCGQTRPADEIIVVDDGSWDQSAQVVERFQRYFGNLRFIARERNGGQHFAIQQGIRESRCDYIVWVASDDLMLPDFLAESMAQADAHPEAGLIFSRLCVWPDGEAGRNEYSERNHGAAFDLGTSPQTFSPEALYQLLQRHYLWISGNTIVCKRSSLLEMGGFEESLRWHADWFGFYVVALRYGAVGIPKTLAMMRERKDTFSATGMNDPASQAKVLRAILRAIESPKYRDVLPVFQRCPSMLSLFGRDMLKQIVKYPPAWNLLPWRLAWHARLKWRWWRDRLIYWKSRYAR